MECVPDFRLRLKLSPRTGRTVFSVDVESVFDIAWLTLARMMTDNPVEEHRAGNHESMIGVMMCCRHCGDYFIRRSNRQEYCDKAESQKARNAKKSAGVQNRKRMAKVGRKGK